MTQLKQMTSNNLSLLLVLFFLFTNTLMTNVYAKNEHKITTKPLDLTTAPNAEQLIQAGQFGGPLYPTTDLSKNVRKGKSTSNQNAENLSFGKAIQAWNLHQYKESATLFKQHIEEFPNSPWVAESRLHLGCESRYQGRFSESEDLYLDIIKNHQAIDSSGSKRLTNKATMRLAVLKTLNNNFEEAGENFKAVYENATDWREKTYASHWINRLSRYQADQLALLDCGTQALAYMLEKTGKTKAAEAVKTTKATNLKGHSLAELQKMAKQYDYDLVGRKITLNELKTANLPIIAQIGGRSGGDKGHYWIIEKFENETLSIHDPQSKRRFHQSLTEFSKEWQGAALVFVAKNESVDSLPGLQLAQAEMESLTGGCCGLPRIEDELGKPPEHTQDKNKDESECGEPKWSINQVNLNFFMRDIPLWYQPETGPAVSIQLSYNSQSAFAYYEPFGNKWQFNYASYFVIDPGNSVTVFMPDGRRDVFSEDASGNYVAPVRSTNTLTALSANRFELGFADGSRYIYDIPAGTSSIQPYLIAIEDKYGKSLQLTYNENVQLTTITDAQGKVTTVTYNTDGLIAKVDDPFGRSAHFAYDANRNLTKIVDMGGIETTLSYDADAYISGVDYGQGLWDINIEPAVNNVSNGTVIYPAPGGSMWANYRITIINPKGEKEEYFYDGYHRTGWYVSPNDYVEYVDDNINNYRTARKTEYSYTFVNQLGVLGSKTTPNGQRINYDYDSSGNRTGITDANGNHIAMTFNNNRYITQITQANGTVTDLTYAENAKDLLRISNGLGDISMEYNANHDLIKLIDRKNNQTQISYNEQGQIVTVTDARNVITEAIYNTQSQLIQVKKAGHIIGAYSYDDKNRIKTATSADGLTLTYAYDNLNRISSVSYPDGKSINYNWSSVRPGLLDKTVNRGNQSQHSHYDSEQQLTVEINAEGGLYQYKYDPNGNLRFFIDANGHVTAFKYDVENRLIEKVYADGGKVQLSYDTGGRLVTKTNARGISTNYSYDVNNNLTEVYYSDNTPAVSYRYDAYNSLVQKTDGLGVTRFSYDANANLIQVDGPWENDTITYGYDVLDRRISMAPELGNPVNYSYDYLGRMASLSSASKRYRLIYEEGSPLIQRLSRPSGARTDYVQDAMLRTTQVSNRNSSGGNLNQFAYTYNAQDMRATEVITNGNAINSLANNQTHYDYNRLNQLLGSANPDKNYQYDADGNMTQGYTATGFMFTASYDAENRMTQLIYTDGQGIVQKTVYVYGANNLVAIIEKYAGENLVSTTRFVRDGFLPIQERNAGNAVTRQYVWRSGALGGIGQLLSLLQAGHTYEYLYDGKGNVSAVIDENQAIVASYRYDAFGVLLSESGSLNQPMRFSTKYYDADTGLSDYGYRFYVASVGRWLNRDPIGENGGVNLYGFVGNNSVNFVDPYGLRDNHWNRIQYFPQSQTNAWAFINFNGKTVAEDSASGWKDLRHKHPRFWGDSNIDPRDIMVEIVNEANFQDSIDEGLGLISQCAAGVGAFSSGGLSATIAFLIGATSDLAATIRQNDKTQIVPSALSVGGMMSKKYSKFFNIGAFGGSSINAFRGGLPSE